MDKPNPSAVGLAVAEIQVLTLGHLGLLDWMARTCGTRILALGSSDKAGMPGHPFTFLQRKAMVEAAYGKGTFAFVSVRDIRATHRGEWCGYVLSRIRGMGLAEPTDYFAGSAHDARWYAPPFPPATDGAGRPDGTGLVWEESGRRMRILDRAATPFPPAREVRDLVEMRDPEWRRHVPERVRELVEWEYPPSLRLPLAGPRPPPGSVPVGTLHMAEVGAPLLELMDDGRWRPAGDGEDEKSRDARDRASRRRDARRGRGGAEEVR
jgi:hypothetical protein